MLSAPQCHAARHAAGAVRGSGTGDVAKAEALVEATGGIFGPHAETKAKPAASGLADQRAHELLADALAARIRFHADRHLRSLFVPVGELELFGGKAPCPGRTDDFTVLFGDEPEIPRSLPADEIFGYGWTRLRRLCIGHIGRHSEEIPQYPEVILDSETDHKIGHRSDVLCVSTVRSCPPLMSQRLPRRSLRRVPRHTLPRGADRARAR